MKLTSKGRFAVTSLVDIALNSVGGKPVSLSEIANRQNISLPFLEQIFYSLKKNGIVKSVRGPSGGYLFAKRPDFIMIYDVISAIDEDLKITRCNGIDYGCIPTKKKSKCLTHNLWNNLTNHILSFLSSVSILDVSKNSYDSIFSVTDRIDKENIMEVRK
jgi:Rrf2 family iron-sulfur cluster assembly transcriptional regulator|tara:strand:+ start:117 stop:596 length:480 start_codon:yes stop_codon:yes gene_type:complete